MLDRIIEKFAENGACLYSITQIRNGNAETRYVTPSSLCHNSYSIAKVFTVTAIGMLYDEGKLSTDEPVREILGKYFPGKYDRNWDKVTLDNLLLHKFGLDRGFLDIDTEDITQYGTDDFLLYAFSHNLPNEVGTNRVYSDAAYYILSRVVAEKSGENLYDFLRKRLFNPLGFREAAWSACPHGYSMGATGLYIRTDDMAKLGQLYLDGGAFGGKRIISEGWVNTVLERGYELKRRPMPETDSYSKGGMYGQMLFLSKTTNLVLAWHAFDRSGTAKTAIDELKK